MKNIKTINPDIFEINGEIYEPIPVKRSLGKKTSALIAMPQIFTITNPYMGVSSGRVFGKNPTLPKETDIVEEFKLIQNKASELSRAQRDYVVYLFNKSYRRVEDPKSFV